MLFGTMFLSVLFASVGAEAIGKEGWQSAKWSDRVEQGEEGGSMGEVLTRSRWGRRQVQTKVITFWNELWLWVHRRNPFKQFFWAENSTEEDVTTVQAASGELVLNVREEGLLPSNLENNVSAGSLADCSDRLLWRGSVTLLPRAVIWLYFFSTSRHPDQTELTSTWFQGVCASGRYGVL